MPKKIPVRQCVACREKRSKHELARIVRTPFGEIVYDSKGKSAGRGAYICKDTKCLEKAIKSNALARALECEIPAETYEALKNSLKEDGANDGE